MNEVGDLGDHFFSSHRTISKDQRKEREASTPFVVALEGALGQMKAMTRNQGGGQNKPEAKKTRVQERSSPRKIILQTFDVHPKGHKRAYASSTSPFCIEKKIKITFC
jgi:hypothetical protein